MKELRCVETDRALLKWRDDGTGVPALVPGTSASGNAVVRVRRPGATLKVVAGGSVSTLPVVPLLLFEQRDYRLYAQAVGEGRTVQIAHRDPNITRGLGSEDGARSIFGRVNFGSQVGRTTFTVLVDGQAELD